ncbi:MAG: hypothetical protein RMN25_12380 [Anaerolineae bacterium]|nr:hypothetical protein [Thermoflexales bacterium]MDW8408567.1 hypothetical protein [Anaerolineae bacterium]
MTNAKQKAHSGRDDQLAHANALKLLIGSASVALTLAGWAVLSNQQLTPESAVAAVERSAAQDLSTSQPASVPTLAPVYVPDGISTDTTTGQGGAGDAPAQGAPEAAPRSELRVVTAPPRAVAVSRSSR